ncbi:MAG: prepilin peptidase [Halioglobus sp.]
MQWQTLDSQYFLLLALLIPACAMDLWRHRIPNIITYPGLLAGLALGLISGGAAGLGIHLLGALAAGFPLLLMFLGGSLGGGDVKLMAAVGAVMGFPAALNALFASIMVGGLCAALILIWQGRLWGLTVYAWGGIGHRLGWRKDPPTALPARRDAFPFGVAITIGTLLTATPPSLFFGG